ncbi:MAG: diphthamide synthesis protein [Candidatus Altiarchaeota archaeon]
MKTLHVPCYSLSDPLPLLRENMGVLGDYPSIGIVSTAQHLDRIPAVRELLESNGKQVFDAGQILGCRRDNARGLYSTVDCFLYVGSGRFHPLGIAIESDRPVFILNPLSGVMDEVSGEEKRRWLKRRKTRFGRAAGARVFGVLVSTKDGQFNIARAFEVTGMLKSRGFKAFIFSGDELTPNSLLPFPVDCWVNTACTRLVDDEFDKPVVNPDELKEIFSLN